MICYIIHGNNIIIILVGQIDIKNRSFIVVMMMIRYMLVKRDDNVTVFNEILINYGHNKITYIENLRFHGRND